MSKVVRRALSVCLVLLVGGLITAVAIAGAKGVNELCAPASSPGSDGVPPIVTIEPATAITGTTAKLVASVQTNQCATKVTFSYGTTSALGTNTAIKSIPASDAPTHVVEAISGLSPTTTYYYRANATSGPGSGTSSLTSLTTSVDCSSPSAPAPTVTTGPAPQSGGTSGLQLT